MKIIKSILISILVLFSSHGLFSEPIRALMITGGCCHDYPKQKIIISEGIKQRAGIPIEWTLHLENTKKGVKPFIYSKANWAEGYDIVVHNECWAHYKNDAEIEKIVQAHVDAKVGVMVIHCAMHTFRDAKTEAWRNLLGVKSFRHDKHYPYFMKKTENSHVIMNTVPDMWKTPKGELYTTFTLDSSTPLAIGFKDDEKDNQVTVWTNRYKNLKVFGITTGHHNETMETEEYLNQITRGFLWTINKLKDE